MAFGTIAIDKIFEKDGVSFYEVSSDDFDVKNFYISITRPQRIVAFYMTSDFSMPIRIIDFNRDQI